MTFAIEKVAVQLGEESIQVEDICKETNQDYQRLILRSGFQNVHRTRLADLEFYDRFLQEHVELSGVDALVFVNQTMENLIPGGISKILADKQNTSQLFVLQISDGCSGFLKALLTAEGLFNSKNVNRIVIICAEKYSKFMNENNSNIHTIFSDAISMVQLNRSKEITIVDYSSENNFSSNEAIQTDSTRNNEINMEGSRVLKWTNSAVTKQVEELMKKNKIELEMISDAFFHQGSKIVLENLSENLGLQSLNLFRAAQYGNVVSSSIPFLLHDNYVKSGQYLPTGFSLLTAFGVGLTTISMILRNESEM
jgi:3-oxoacyl-[acyl-carrier-protein] synthase-3